MKLLYLKFRSRLRLLLAFSQRIEIFSLTLAPLIAMAASVPVRIDSLPVTARTHIELFSDGISEIDSHCHEPGHQLRWSSVNIKDRVIGLMGLFWTVIGSIQSDLELSQWRANMLGLATVVSKHVFQTIDEGLVHLDCRVTYQIADTVQEALTFICKVQARLSGELPTIECALGWVQFNRYCRVRCPAGLTGHHGPAALGFLRLLSVARNSIKQLFLPNHPLEEVRPSDIPAFRIDLSWLIIDRESDCYSGLKAIFNSLVAITTFIPLFEPELDNIVPFHMAIALPASLIDGLLNGPSPSIPTPLGQLNPCYSIDSCLRKLSHWYYQDCFSPAQVKEQVRIVIYKPLLKHQSRELKRTDAYGGYANFHNCAFTGFSWCGIVNSDTWSLLEIAGALPQHSDCVVIAIDRGRVGFIDSRR